MTANSSIDPQILSASGRSEYHPVDPEDKARNRRIEIVLSPNLGACLNCFRNRLRPPFRNIDTKKPLIERPFLCCAPGGALIQIQYAEAA